MQQQINLYTFIPVIEDNRCSFKQSLRIISIFVIILLCSNAWQLVSRVVHSYKIASLAAKKKVLARQVAQLEGQVPEEEKIVRAESDMKLLKKERRDKNNILNTLTRLQFKEEIGYSLYLQALARKKVPGIQITNFTFGNGGKQVQISGLTTKPALVPEFLQQLSAEAVFANKVFEKFSLNQEPNSELIAFKLHTNSIKQANEQENN